MFGPSIPLEGIEAPLILADPLDACSPLSRDRYEGKVVLALRGKCTFIEKAINAEDAGAEAILISNSPEAVGIFPMSASEDESLYVTIPSMMITFADAIELANRAQPAFTNSSQPTLNHEMCTVSEGKSHIRLQPKNPESYADSLFLHITIPLAKKVADLYPMQRIHFPRQLSQIFLMGNTLLFSLYSKDLRLSGAQANFVFDPNGQLWASLARSQGNAPALPQLPPLPPGLVQKP